jgi:methylenetetrahydrofolate--tRNA-(uracil-5-)-methyltransferase
MGVSVDLYEMRPQKKSPAHHTGDLAELVCSNSLGSNLLGSPAGVLKEEMRRLGSLLLSVADGVAVPSGGALAVDREAFAEEITRRIETHPYITVHRSEVEISKTAYV